jgi:hypothetical protein
MSGGSGIRIDRSLTSSLKRGESKGPVASLIVAPQPEIKKNKKIKEISFFRSCPHLSLKMDSNITQKGSPCQLEFLQKYSFFNWIFSQKP